jgi:hypothetical protein
VRTIQAPRRGWASAATLGVLAAGPTKVVGGGMALFCAALAWIITSSQDASYAIIAVQMVVLGVGMGFTQAPATEAIMGAVPKRQAGVASAVNGSTRLFGGTLGVAVIGSIAASLYTTCRQASRLTRQRTRQRVRRSRSGSRRCRAGTGRRRRLPGRRAGLGRGLRRRERQVRQRPRWSGRGPRRRG